MPRLVRACLVYMYSFLAYLYSTVKILYFDACYKSRLFSFVENEDKYEDVSVIQDDALDDILQELTSPSLIKHSKTNRSVVLSKSKSKVAEFTKTKPHSKRNADKEVGSRTIFNLSKGNVLGAVSGKETCTSDDWTREDDAYFAKLGVETDVKAAKKQNPKDREENFEIEHYLTPCILATERSRSPPSEIEIEEFVTQEDYDPVLCEQMERLSPFKVNRYCYFFFVF